MGGTQILLKALKMPMVISNQSSLLSISVSNLSIMLFLVASCCSVILSDASRSTMTTGFYYFCTVSWPSKEMRKVYEELIREVEIVMMMGLARHFEDNLELMTFVGGLEMENGK